ncbi:hypothetical protein [Micromonospora sp. 067-2]
MELADLLLAVGVLAALLARDLRFLRWFSEVPGFGVGVRIT